MSYGSIIRISGIIAIAAGIFNVLSGLPTSFSKLTLELFRRAADISALIGITGIYFYQRNKLGKFGHISFVIVFIGILMLIFSFQYEVAIGIYAVGLFAFGIVTIQAGVIPKWAAWMWVIAPFISVPAFLFSSASQLLFQVAAIMFALGFVGAGFHIAST